jgi:hypothetical protein
MSKTTKVVIAVVLVVVGLPVIIMVLAMSNFFSIARQTLSSTASYGVVNQKMAYPLEARDEMMAPMSEPSYTSAPQDKMMIRPPVGVGGSVAADATSRLIVKNGSLSAVVKDVWRAIEKKLDIANTIIITGRPTTTRTTAITTLVVLDIEDVLKIKLVKYVYQSLIVAFLFALHQLLDQQTFHF